MIHPSSPVLLVGIGARRDDAEACARLLRTMPPGLGASYVIAGGLDAAALADQRLPQVVRTLAVRDSVRMERDQVYLVSPNSHLRLRESVLSAHRDTKVSRPAGQVDALFSELARVSGDRAAGIVLAVPELQARRGAEAITRAGGLMMGVARDPEASLPAGFEVYLPLDRLADELVARVAHTHR
ncbi:MAG TPA: chemotaxis protein CheB, partial [Kofleriaceae bacterium]|nr:chemotaxis protein CheB [Kofleriaceae bacterium]